MKEIPGRNGTIPAGDFCLLRKAMMVLDSNKGGVR